MIPLPSLSGASCDAAVLDLAGRARLGKHQRSVGALSRALAQAFGLERSHCDLIGKAGSLHDVGKLFIPTFINEKPSQLTEVEAHIMRFHAVLGKEYLEMFGGIQVAQLGAKIACEHHENWDGTGYPHGIAGDAIGIGSRIVAICDVYSALRENRPYKIGLSSTDAAETVISLNCSRGICKFDPKLLNIFKNKYHIIRDVFHEYHN